MEGAFFFKQTQENKEQKSHRKQKRNDRIIKEEQINFQQSASSHVPPLGLPGPQILGSGRGGSKGTTNWYLGVSRPMHARAKMQSFLRGP